MTGNGRSHWREPGSDRSGGPSPTPEPGTCEHQGRTQAIAAAQPRTRPMAVVAAEDPAASGEWPKTEPIGAIDYEDYSRVATRPAPGDPPGRCRATRAARATRATDDAARRGTTTPIPGPDW